MFKLKYKHSPLRESNLHLFYIIGNVPPTYQNILFVNPLELINSSHLATNVLAIKPQRHPLYDADGRYVVYYKIATHFYIFVL